MTECANCGRSNRAGAQFCASCGEYLGWEAPAARAEQAPSPSPAAPPTEAPSPAGPPPAPVVSDPPQAPVRQLSTLQDRDVATTSVAHAVSALDEGRRVAEKHQRPDVGRHLAVARQRLADQVLGVAVVGEFKRGKSTLVNALLQTDICPVDADIVTAVPTVIRYGAPPTAVAHLDAADDRPADAPGAGEAGSRTVEQEIDVDRLADFVSEAGDAGIRKRLRSVEVRLSHRLLRTGLCLIDTPGVGGLDSAHGTVTLSALSWACGVLFVTDASQELTAPEVDFLRQAMRRCPTAACVVTKTDLYPEWRRIVALDEAHLRDAGIDIPVLPVSSFLRLRAWRAPELNEESGFGPLFDWLRSKVVEPGAHAVVSAAARDLGFARDQLRTPVQAERQVLDQPTAGPQVVRKLHRARETAGRLSGTGATWQQALSDGIQDLVADVEHDLQERLRTLFRAAEELIDQGDPKDTWPDVELWLQRQVVAAATANYDMLNERAEQLAHDVASAFALESEVPLELGLTVPAQSLLDVTLGAADAGAQREGRMGRLVFVGRSVSFVPMLVFGFAGHLLGLAVVGPLSIALGAGIGRKLLRDERLRQLTHRRQQAKIAARRYVDDVAFIVAKDCRDSLRRTQRELRDEFQARAAVLQLSTERALASAQRATQLTVTERQARAAELAAHEREIDTLGRGLRAPAARGAA